MRSSALKEIQGISLFEILITLLVSTVLITGGLQLIACLIRIRSEAHDRWVTAVERWNATQAIRGGSSAEGDDILEFKDGCAHIHRFTVVSEGDNYRRVWEVLHE